MTIQLPTAFGILDEVQESDIPDVAKKSLCFTCCYSIFGRVGNFPGIRYYCAPFNVISSSDDVFTTDCPHYEKREA